MRAVAAILDGGQPTRFRWEGSVRAGLRSFYCLQGHEWQRADLYVSQIIEFAFARLGVTRPTWAQGQPEIDDTQYFFCMGCSKPLPAGRLKFCCDECKGAFGLRKRRAQAEFEQERAQDGVRGREGQRRAKTELPRMRRAVRS